MVIIPNMGEYKDHQMIDTFGFLTTDRQNKMHMYVVGEYGNAIDISDESHCEYNDYETVESLVEDAGEKLVRVFSHFEEFSLTFCIN